MQLNINNKLNLKNMFDDVRIESDLTEVDIFDTIDIDYNSWEEIPVSALHFKGTNKQWVYVAVDKNKAVNILNNKGFSQKVKAYEHKENISLKGNEVIVAVCIDTTSMLDLTNISEYKKSLQFGNLTDLLKQHPGVNLLRKVEICSSEIVLCPKLAYYILNNSAVSDVRKI